MSPEEHDVSTVSIVPSANVGLDNWSRASLNGTVDGDAFPENTDEVFAVTAFVSDNPGGDRNPYFHNAAVNCNEQGVCLFSPDKYYSPNKIHYFYAYSPVKYGNPVYNDLSKENKEPTVTFTIDGQQDIMWAKDDSGIPTAKSSETQQQPKLQFKHLLKKLRFCFIQGEGFGSDIHVTTIRVKNVRNVMTLDVLTGNLTFEGNADATVEVHGTWSINPKEISVALPHCCIMCEPGAEADIEIVANQVIYPIKLNLNEVGDDSNAGGAGVSHLITVTFNGTHVIPSAEIEDWTMVGEATGNLK